jgi:Tissue inhibitor of metalloproteinase
MRSIVVLLGILIVISVSSQTANACTCGGTGSPCESYGSADAVFVGTVVAERENERPKKADRNDIDWIPMAYKFSVEQSYLGVSGTEAEVFTGRGGGDCGYDFKVGQRYLVYAYRYNNNKLSTGICTRTRPFSSANEDLAFLGTLSSAAPGVTIHGAIYDREGKSGPVSPDILITLEGESDRKEIPPDGEGRFRVSGLRAGKYKVSVKLPDTLTTYRPEQEITVADRGCARVGWYVTDNGRVTGRVINADGEPVPRIYVSLVYADADDKDREKMERTDNDGQFMFSGILRGRYFIAVNHTRFPEPNDPTSAYPPVFYPGVVDRAHAKAIAVGAGEKVTDIEVRIPSKRPAGILNGTVVWSDGLPVANAQLSVMDVTQGEGFYYGVAADEQGQFKIEGYVGQKLVIEARSNRTYVPSNKPNDPMERVEKKRITLEGPAETLRIVITKLR